MKTFLKIFYINLLFLWFFINWTINAYDNDCYIFEWGEENGNHEFKIVDEIFKNPDKKNVIERFIDKKSLNFAILNLKNACNSKSDENRIKSLYLFDHIFDIIMRKYAWIEKDFYNWLSLDEKWKEWREYITKIATTKGRDNDEDFKNPNQIISKYKEMRTTHKEYNINWELINIYASNHWILWNYITESQKGWDKIKEIIDEYENWSLTDKYNNACDISILIYSILIWTENGFSEVSNNLVNCTNIAKNQIEKENNYTNIVIQKTTNLFQKFYVSKYVEYLNWRINKLEKTRKDSDDKFNYIANAIPKIVRNCKK